MDEINYDRTGAEAVRCKIAKGDYLKDVDNVICYLSNLASHGREFLNNLKYLIKTLSDEIQTTWSVKKEAQRRISCANEEIRCAQQPKQGESEAEARERMEKMAQANAVIRKQQEILAGLPDLELLERDKKRIERLLYQFEKWVQLVDQLRNNLLYAREASVRESDKLLARIDRAMEDMEQYMRVRI